MLPTINFICSFQNSNDEDETVDVEGDSEFEEWTESQRRRTNSLIAGLHGKNKETSRLTSIYPHPFRLGSAPSSSGRVSTDVDAETDDVIVDGDEPEDASTFGPSQYSESDVVIKICSDKQKEKEGKQSQVATVNSSGDVEVKLESAGQQCDSNVSTSDAEPSSRAQMIEELRNRIRQLEAEGGLETTTSSETEDYKCLICLV